MFRASLAAMEMIRDAREVVLAVRAVAEETSCRSGDGD